MTTREEVTPEELMRCLPDPDAVGESEYRAIYDALNDLLWDCPQEERRESVEGIAEAMLDAATLILQVLRSPTIRGCILQ